LILVFVCFSPLIVSLLPVDAPSSACDDARPIDWLPILYTEGVTGIALFPANENGPVRLTYVKEGCYFFDEEKIPAVEMAGAGRRNGYLRASVQPLTIRVHYQEPHSSTGHDTTLPTDATVTISDRLSEARARGGWADHPAGGRVHEPRATPTTY